MKDKYPLAKLLVLTPLVIVIFIAVRPAYIATDLTKISEATFTEVVGSYFEDKFPEANKTVYTSAKSKYSLKEGENELILYLDAKKTSNSFLSCGDKFTATDLQDILEKIPTASECFEK